MNLKRFSFAKILSHNILAKFLCQIIDTLFATVHQEVVQCMKIQIYQKAGLAKSVKGKVVHLLENGTFTLLGSILFWAHFGQVLANFSLCLAFCYQKLFWPFTVRINCSSDLNFFFQILSLHQSSNFKSFSWSLEQFFLTVGQNNFGNKIPFLSSAIATRM